MAQYQNYKTRKIAHRPGTRRLNSKLRGHESPRFGEGVVRRHQLAVFTFPSSASSITTYYKYTLIKKKNLDASKANKINYCSQHMNIICLFSYIFNVIVEMLD